MTGKGKRKYKPRQRPAKHADAGKTIDLEITEMAPGGQAVGLYRGKSVFVPYTLPGESISAEITEGRGSVFFARGKRLKAASADRVAPPCSHFGPGACWGCQFQHINYPTQLLLKQDVLADQLSRVGKLSDSLIDKAMRPFVPAAEQWAYNHRLALWRDRAGNWGLRRYGKGGIESISECHVSHPDLLNTLAELDLDFDRARRLTLQRGGDGHVMLIFHVDAEEAPQLQTDLPLSVNLILPDNEPVNLIGDTHSNFKIGGRDIRVTAGSAIRPNIGQINALIKEVAAGLRLSGAERVLDLYAGVGIYSARLAGSAALVTVVDSYPPAVSDAEANLRDYDHIDIVEGQVEAVLQDMVASEASYSVALVDPPSSGISNAILQSLKNLGVQQLVYVSGDPASLARDCRRLLDAGFQLETVQGVDMAPQTYYITAVATFFR